MWMLAFFPKGATAQLNMSERDNGQAPAKHALRRQEIDWAGLRAAAVAIGILPAARQAAQDLPLDERERFVQRAMKRCSGQKCLLNLSKIKPMLLRPLRPLCPQMSATGPMSSVRRLQKIAEKLGSLCRRLRYVQRER